MNITINTKIFFNILSYQYFGVVLYPKINKDFIIIVIIIIIIIIILRALMRRSKCISKARKTRKARKARSYVRHEDA